jgi:hypothetical protein
MTYEDFKSKIVKTLSDAEGPLTWTEIRTAASLPQLFPNNQWVHRLEKDAGLNRRRDANGIIHWQLSGDSSSASNEQTAKASETARTRARRK